MYACSCVRECVRVGVRPYKRWCVSASVRLRVRACIRLRVGTCVCECVRE